MIPVAGSLSVWDRSRAFARALLFVGLAVTFSTVAVTQEAFALTDPTPTDSVKHTITDVLRILQQDELKQPDRIAERRLQVEQVIRQGVSYEEMAQRALGATWLSLSETEQKEFVDLFVQLLREAFAGKIDRYADEQVQYLSEDRQLHAAEVHTKLVGQKLDTLLDFRLADRSGEWLVYDVVIDGASIVGNYRAQFTNIMRDHAYSGLVERMKQHMLIVKTFEQTAAP
ncbi:MAG: ABC transporter substrate-binding protein [Nitrospiraceae bacterium]|nr:ABC transporter substrate-binding protein [Nitrospiraceae bacterium]